MLLKLESINSRRGIGVSASIGNQFISDNDKGERLLEDGHAGPSL